MKTSNSNRIIAKIKDILKGSIWRSKLLSDKLCSILEEIPELISFINEDNYHNTKLILEELSQNMEIKEYKSGNYIRKVLGSGDDFYMILSGTISELEIKYINTTMTFKEFVLFLTKLYLLNENFLYNDCLKKNNDMFPFYTFKNYVNFLKKNNGIENEKNSFEENNSGNNNIFSREKIDIISICKEINIKEFNFKEELRILKNKIQNSAWFRRKNYLQVEENIDSNIMINKFLDLYNYNIGENSNNNFSVNETKYKVCIPYFMNKKILEPISFIGNLDKPQNMKSYIGYICLTDCFIIYLDKNLLKPNQPIYRFSKKKENNSMVDKLFSNHFLFKNIDKDYLNKNFGKYFKMRYLKKNDFLFKQNEPHKGIYIILKGVFQLKANKSYNELNDLNFTLLHSLDNYPQYITTIKSEQINPNVNFNNKKNYLKGYYEYNSNENQIMKNPIFAEKAKEKSEIFFCLYGENDILGLGEVFNSKVKINTFTAKCISDEAELFFLPNEVFNGLISNDNIYNKCALIIEEKVNMLTRCISKYRHIFEKKIEYMVNNENEIDIISTKKLARNDLSGKKLPIKGFNAIINKININKLYKSSSSDFYTINGKDLTLKILKDENENNKEENKDKSSTNTKQNYYNVYENLNKDENYISRINTLLSKNEEEKKNYFDINPNNENIKILSRKKLLVVPNIEKKINYNSLAVATPKTDKREGLNDKKTSKNSPLFTGNKRSKNTLIKSSSSVLNDDAGIKKRMEEISRFYSGNIKRKSGPVIISFLTSSDEKKKKLRSKIKKEQNSKMKGRCLSAYIYDENNFQNIFNKNNNNINSYKKTSNNKNNEAFNKLYNNMKLLSSKKRNILSGKNNINILNKQRKITINKFGPTTLFPNINNTNEKK